MPTLTWQRAEGKPQVFRLAHAEISIGRDAGNAVRLDSTFVSRQHAVIRGTGRAFTITDLGSANGTFVNGVRVETAPLAAGDTIKLGSESLVFAVRGRLSGARLAIAGLAGVILVLGVLLMLAPAPEQDAARVGQPQGQAPPTGEPSGQAVSSGGAVGAPLLPAGGSPPTDEASVVPAVPAGDAGAAVSPAESAGGRADGSALYDAALAHIKGDRLLEARQLLVEAIQVGPENPSARQRLLEVDATIQARIEQHLAAGQQQVSYLRFREAILEWEQVIALTAPTDDRHQQALDAIERARLRLGGR